MPLRIGLLVYPLFLIVLAFGKNAGTVSKFLKVGAVSPQTARKPTSVGKVEPDFVQRAVKRGALIATGDGRYYVNLQRVEQLRRRMRYITAGVTVLFAGLALLAWHPWT